MTLTLKTKELALIIIIIARIIYIIRIYQLGLICYSRIAMTHRGQAHDYPWLTELSRASMVSFGSLEMASHRPSGYWSSANGTKTPGVSCCAVSAREWGEKFGDAVYIYIYTYYWSLTNHYLSLLIIINLNSHIKNSPNQSKYWNS